ncbi:MAG: alpha/beta fold hydrolase [Bacteroidota bacterium]
MKITLFSFLLFLPLLCVGINPVREYTMTPDQAGMAYEAHRLTTLDAYELEAWWLHPYEDTSSVTFVLAYGDAGNMSYSLAYASSLLRRGYRVLLFDYRGFGHSTDFTHDPQALYHQEYAIDLATALLWVKARRPKDRIAVWAFSMGTLMATLAYEQAPFDALIAEGLIESPLACVARIEELKGTALVLPEGAEEAPKLLRGMSIPMLLVAGTGDEVTPLSASMAVAEGRPERRVLPHNGEHLRAAVSLGLPEYMEEIEDFLWF